jgi:hypothetical protein
MPKANPLTMKYLNTAVESDCPQMNADCSDLKSRQIFFFAGSANFRLVIMHFSQELPALHGF